MADLQRQFDGDAGFVGIDTRSNPASLKQGVLQDGNNIRLDLQSLQVRKGLKRTLNEGFVTTIGLVVGTGIYVRNTDGKEFIAIVGYKTGLNRFYLYDTLTNTIALNVAMPSNRPITSGHVQLLQAQNKLYILRGEATRYITGNGSAGQQASVGGAPHTTITVTTSTPHGLNAGDEFAIETVHTLWNGPTSVNDFVVATVPTSTSFTYTITTGHSGSASAYVIQVAKPVLVFDGTSVTVVRQGVIDGTILGGTTPTACDFPPTSTAIYHKNRIYCKYSKDEIAVSDYLSDTTGNWQFDLTIQALSINIGDEQDITGFHPWTRDTILVFKTNSIYEAKFADNTSTPDIVLAESYVRALTYDIGCVAKNSIANVSGIVFFMSQRGIYKLEPQLDVALLANTAPMSLSIQKYIESINYGSVKNSVGTVWNGRYYLAVPTNSSTTNNKVFVYNLTNQMWESVDTYPSAVSIDNILTARTGTVSNVNNDMVFCSSLNGIYIAEQTERDEYGSLTSSPSFANYPYVAGPPEIPEGIPLEFQLEPEVYNYDVIRGYAKTRRYIFNTLLDKRFVSVNTDLKFDGIGAIKTNVVTYNPDTTLTIDTTSSDGASDKTRRFPIRKVAVGCELDFISLNGRPTVMSTTIESQLIGRNITNKT